jgi:hypothetical protein
MHGSTYRKYSKQIPSLMNLIYYLLIAQGDYSNPQLRPIAIAEMYARDLLAYLNINEKLKEFKLTPTVNQQRFG